MIIKLKNKDMLMYDTFNFKCCVGLKGLKFKKKEGDKTTPKGTFSLGKIYYRSDRVKKPETFLNLRKIKKNMGWCHDVNSKSYNSEVQINKNTKSEKLFRDDNKYDYFLVINYNPQREKLRGSAIFIHLTNNYKPTAGCIALKKKDFLILIKIIKKQTKIIIN